MYFIILVLSVLLLVIITWGIIFFFKEDKNDIKATIKKAKKMLEEERYEDILILRKKEKWSRSLWVEGKPYARLELGGIAKTAAINLQDYKNLTEIYIDDLGWTFVSVGKYGEAKTNLQRGLECAEKIQDNDDKYYWLAKAKRHLAGIEVENEEYSKSDALMNESISFANNIKDEQRKNEMLAGIYYGQSIRFLKAGPKDRDNIGKSLKYAKDSEALRKVGEETRSVKIYSLKGNIYEAKGDKPKAEEQYRIGLKQSKELKRTDEFIKNSLGLARILNNEKEKKQLLKKAKELLSETPVPYIIDEQEMRLIKQQPF